MELEAKSESSVELNIDIEPSFIEFDDVESNLMEVDEEGDKNNLVFVDIQGFRSRNGAFICKEFCLVSGDDVYHSIIKSPFRFGKLLGHFKNQANYNTRYIHGLTWECGDDHLIDFLQTAYMKTLGKIIVVKGDQKVKWLEYLFRNCGEIDCKNMEDWGYCKSVHLNTKMYEICDYHNSNYSPKWRCAKENALKLQEIVTKYELDVSYF